MGSARSARPPRRFDGVELDAPPGAGRGDAEAAERRSTPTSAPRCWRRSRRARLVHADQRRTDVTTQVVPGGTVTERWVPVGRVGLYVPGGLAMYPSTRGDERGAGPGRRRRRARRGEPAAEGQRRPARRPGARRLRAARRRRGLRRRRRPGDRDARATATRASCEPVDLITGPGNIWVTAAKRLLRGVVGIDAEAGPTEIAILADDTADPVHVAADLISQAEHDPLAASVLVTDVAWRWPTRSRPSWPAQVAATKHTERVTAALTGEQSGDGAGRRPRAGAAGGRRVRRRAPGDPDPRRRGRGRCGSATPARSSSAPTRRCRSATTAPAPTTCCPPAAAPGTRSGLSVQSFLRGIHVDRVRRGGAARRRRATWSTLANVEDLPAHGEAVTARFDPA